MSDVADITLMRRPSHDGVANRAPAAAARSCVPLTAVSPEDWRVLGAHAIEPNGYYLPDWALAVNATAQSRAGSSALCSFDRTLPSPRLTGLQPVVSLRRAYGIPLPALVSGHPYGTLCTPLLDRELAVEAAAGLLQAARDAGARALVLREVSVEGPAMQALADALARDGLRTHLLESHQRALLDATRDADELLHDALGGKKLKDLRRLRNRLADHGEVVFEVAKSADDVAAAVETFLVLEASGWKGRRGTALIQHAGDAAFIRRATVALAGLRQCEIISLRAGDTPVASAVVLRHLDRAWYFKLGVDERFAKYSPGVQLTLDLTRHLCADPAIRSADSTAGPDHPMINPLWRRRLAIGDVLIPLRPRDPVVSVIRTALFARRHALDMARRGLRRLRSR